MKICCRWCSWRRRKTEVVSNDSEPSDIKCTDRVVTALVDFSYSGVDLDLKARGGIVAREERGENSRGVASLRAAQHTYVYDN